jgi:hypothetical protein
MRRRVFPFISMFSLLLALAVTAAGVRSRWYATSWSETIYTPTARHEGTVRGRYAGLRSGRFLFGDGSHGAIIRELQHGGVDPNDPSLPVFEVKRLTRWRDEYMGVTVRRRWDFGWQYTHHVGSLGSGVTTAKFLGFEYYHDTFPASSSRSAEWSRSRYAEWSWQLYIPCWFIVLALGIAPALHLASAYRKRRRHRLIARGLCADCGYDLRARTDRCPECGAEFEPPQPTRTGETPVSP